MEGEIFAVIAGVLFAARGVFAALEKDARAILTSAAGATLALGAYLANL